MHRYRFAAVASAVLRFTGALLLATASASAPAAELGEVAIRSHIGQPLIADIELTALADATAPVGVKLASADVYRGANITMHPALASMNMSVMRRDGRQFLHITSIKPIDSEYVHIFVELTDAGKRNVRAETLWLTPDPLAPPIPTPVAGTQAAPLAAPVPAFVRPASKAPLLARPTAAPAMCPPAAPVKACAASAYQNGLLSAQIVELEDKVKALELGMKARGEPAQQLKATAKPAPRALAAPTVARPKNDGFPWLLTGAIAALVVAIAAAATGFMLRRRGAAAAGAEPPAAASAPWLARLRERFRRKAKPEAAVEPGPPKEA